MVHTEMSAVVAFHDVWHCESGGRPCSVQRQVQLEAQIEVAYSAVDVL